MERWTKKKKKREIVTDDLVFWSFGSVLPRFGASVNSVLTSRALRSITVKCGHVDEAVAARDQNELLLIIMIFSHDCLLFFW